MSTIWLKNFYHIRLWKANNFNTMLSLGHLKQRRTFTVSSICQAMGTWLTNFANCGHEVLPVLWFITQSRMNLHMKDILWGRYIIDSSSRTNRPHYLSYAHQPDRSVFLTIILSPNMINMTRMIFFHTSQCWWCTISYLSFTTFTTFTIFYKKVP